MITKQEAYSTADSIVWDIVYKGKSDVSPDDNCKYFEAKDKLHNLIDLCMEDSWSSQPPFIGMGQ